MIQPKLIILTMAATNAPLSATRILATMVRIISRAGNGAVVRVGFSTFAYYPDPGAFTAPGTLDATNSKIIPVPPATEDRELKLELSDGEVERGQYFDLSQIYINGTASDKVEVLYTPVGQIDR